MGKIRKIVFFLTAVILSAASSLTVLASAVKNQDGWGFSGSYIADSELDDPLGFRGFGQGGNTFYSGPGTEWPDEIKDDLQMIGGVYVEETNEIWMISGSYLVSFHTGTAVFSVYDMNVMTGITDDPGNIFTLASTYQPFYGGAYDGSYVWFAPAQSNRIVRVDPYTGEGTALPIIDTGGLLPDYDTESTTAYKFGGMVFDGDSIWMIPQRAEYAVKIDPGSGDMTALTLDSNIPADCNVLTITRSKFSGGTYDGRYIWMAPYGSNSILRIDTIDDSLSYFLLNEILGGDPEDYDNTTEYTSVIYDNKSRVYFIPFKGSSMIAVDTSQTLLKTEVYPVIVTEDDWGEEYYSEELSTLNNNLYAKFRSAAFDGQNIWLTPSWDADTIVRFDTKTGKYTAYCHYTALPNVGMDDVVELSETTSSLYIGSVFDGNHVWFIPRASDRLVRLEPYARIEGTVTDQGTGAAVPGAEITISDQADSSNVYYIITTDENGSYMAHVPPLQDYLVTVTLPAAYYDSVPDVQQKLDSIGTGETGRADFALLAKGVLTIEKNIDRISAKPQTFVYQVEFMGGRDSAAKIFYGTVTVEAGSTGGAAVFEQLYQGSYTVTELDRSLYYQLDGGYLQSQDVYIGDGQGLDRTVDYLNNRKNSGWISGTDQITNTFAD